MAERRRIENGVGMLPLPEAQELRDTSPSKLAGAITALQGTLRDTVRALNGRMSLGNGDQSTQSGNLDGQWIEYVFPSPANTEAEIPHGLGRAPAGYFVARADRACRVYDSNTSGWGKERFYLKCDTASAVVKLFVF